MDIITSGGHHITLQETKEEFDSSDEDSQEETEAMEMPTTVTIVEEDGSTSVVEDVATVSSIVSDAGPNSSIRFGQNSSGGLTYQVVGMSTEDPIAYQAAPAGVQILNSSSLNGQYYVINQSDVLTGRPVATTRSQIIDPRSFGRFGIMKTNHTRDDKKRATHNEVERRRRDKINAWIAKLAKIVPACIEDNTSKSQSKGGILAKACEYIGELRSTNCRLADTLKEHESTAEELDALRRQVIELRKENMMLKQQLGPTEDDSTVIITTSE